MNWLVRILFSDELAFRYFTHETEAGARKCIQDWEPAGVLVWQIYEMKESNRPD